MLIRHWRQRIEPDHMFLATEEGVEKKEPRQARRGGLRAYRGPF